MAGKWRPGKYGSAPGPDPEELPAVPEDPLDRETSALVVFYEPWNAGEWGRDYRWGKLRTEFEPGDVEVLPLAVAQVLEDEGIVEPYPAPT